MPGGNRKLQELNDPLVIGAMGTGALLAAFVAAVGGWIGYSALRINHRAPLPPATNAERRTFISPAAGMISYYVERKATGRPLVLVHTVNAAASAYEMMPIFEHYRGKRPVYALDLPGFGFSDRSPRVYSASLYADALSDFLRTQVREGSADVVALSLGSEFAARAARAHPELFNTLTLISPSGFTDRSANRSRQRTDSLYRLLSFPLWSQALYDLLVTPPSINYFLKQSFEGKVDPGLKHYAYATSHQPGARFAPLYFVSGKLFSPEIRETVYEQLTLPVLVLFDKDSFVRFDTLPQLAATHANWRTVRIAPTKGLPHFEKMSDVAQALDALWQGTDVPQQASQEVSNFNV